jgi:16S rRNA processing protein RimM
VHFFGDGPETLEQVDEVWLARSPDDADATRYALQRARPGRPGEVRVALEGLSRREQADELRGRLVLAEVSSLPALPEGEHYWFEWVGCRVEGSDGQEVGRIVEIWESGAHDVLVVASADGRRLLLPAARDLIREVDLEQQRIVMELVPGILSAEVPGE